MLLAKIENDILIVQEHNEMFPTTSFSVYGIDEEFMTKHNLLPVSQFKYHDRATQKLEYCTPYLEDNIVYIVKIVDKTEEEMQVTPPINN